MDLTFISKFNNYLLNNGFFIVENEIFKNSIYFKNIGSNGYIIIPILNDNKNSFENIENIYNYILKKFNLNKIFVLKLLIDKQILQNDINFLENEINLENKIVNIIWGVDLTNKNIIIKSKQPTKFLNIQNYIKLALDENYKNVVPIKLNKSPNITYALICTITIIHILVSINPIIKYNTILNYAISPKIFENKEYFRFITFLFLHSNIKHLLSNILSLYIFGTRIEKYLGKIVFLIVFIIGGLASGIFSILFTKTYSIGASGAIFALESATLYFSIKEKIKLDGLDYYTILIFLLFGIIASFNIENIDNAGHIGGFLAGLIVLSLYYNTHYKIKK